MSDVTNLTLRGLEDRRPDTYPTGASVVWRELDGLACLCCGRGQVWATSDPRTTWVGEPAVCDDCGAVYTTQAAVPYLDDSAGEFLGPHALRLFRRCLGRYGDLRWADALDLEAA